jgi:DNA-binding SARP family transcriptional activator
MLSIAVLGPVEVRRDGAVVPLPSGKTTEVLVRLAIDAGAPVRADRLIDDLWADVAATTGRNTLQSKVSQLRRALGVPGVITSGPGGYALDVEPGRVDALRVVTLATTASDLRQGGDLADAADLSGRRSRSSAATCLSTPVTVPGCNRIGPAWKRSASDCSRTTLRPGSSWGPEAT